MTVRSMKMVNYLAFVQDNGLVIINSLPMAKGIFTRRAYDYDKGKLLESVLDYAIIQEEALDQVSSFVIDEHNRYQITSDHSTIVVEIKLEANKKVVNWRVRNDWCVF